MTKWTLLATIPLFAIAGTMAATPAPRSTPAIALERATEAALRIASFKCTANCEFGSCDEGDHENLEHAGGNDSAQITHECGYSGTDCNYHSCSVGQRLDIETLDEALNVLDGTQIRQLMYVTDRVTVNLERGAVQVFGCDDRVLMSRPLTDQQYKALIE